MDIEYIDKREKFDEKVYFEHNDFYMKFSSLEECQKFYEENIKGKDYLPGKTYEYTTTVVDRDDHKLYFINSNEIVSDEEAKILLDYCDCELCESITGFGCPCCYGCYSVKFDRTDERNNYLRALRDKGPPKMKGPRKTLFVILMVAVAAAFLGTTDVVLESLGKLIT